MLINSSHQRRDLVKQLCLMQLEQTCRILSSTLKKNQNQQKKLQNKTKHSALGEGNTVHTDGWQNSHVPQQAAVSGGECLTKRRAWIKFWSARVDLCSGGPVGRLSRWMSSSSRWALLLILTARYKCHLYQAGSLRPHSWKWAGTWFDFQRNAVSIKKNKK